MHADERAAALLFFGHAFVLLICYYILKTVREPLLLGGGSAELKSYAYAVTALVLLVLVPLYSVLFRRLDKGRLVRSITALFVASFALLYVLGRAGADVGFAYYVWVGVFGVMILAQFWAHAAHAFNVECGQRLFPMIMAGGVLGGLAGPPLVRTLYSPLGAWNLLLLAVALLAATLPLAEWARQSVPRRSCNGEDGEESAVAHVLGGFALVLRQRYLLLLAALVVLLNCVNATGEFILTDFVIRHAEERLSGSPHLDEVESRQLMERHIARFYGNYHLAVNALAALLQIALVARLFRWIGVRGALLVLPVVAFACYGLIMFLPVFGIVRAAKVLENATEYSLMNTVRHTLYLPLPVAQKFEGKTAIDTFFWRLGDVLQAGVIYAGLNWLGLEVSHFALLNMLLAALWIVIAVQLAKHYAGPRTRRAVTINWRALALAASRHLLLQPRSLFGNRQPLRRN